MPDRIRDTLLTRVIPEIRSAYEDVQRSVSKNRILKQIDTFRHNVNGETVWGWNNDDYPSVRFAADNVSILLTIFPKGKPVRELNVHLAYSNRLAGLTTLPFPLLKVCSNGLLGRVARDHRLIRMKFNDTILDSSFVCYTQEEYAARRLLDSAARRLIESLYYQLPIHGLYLGLASDQMMVKKVFPVDSFTRSNLERLNGSLLALINGFRELLIIEKVDEALSDLINAVVIEEIPTCRVCGEQIFLEKVHCLACETPHHRDCWEYTGACAMFGCGADEFVDD